MKTALPPFRLEAYFARWEFTARHHLTASDAESLTLDELLALTTEERRAAFHELPLGYVPTWGTEQLREAIAGTYDTVDAEHVLAFAGAEEAIFWALQELLGPDDHAIVTVPNYQAMESVPLATGAAVDGVLLRAEDGWALDVDAVERLMRPQTRVVAINFPNNPTGAVPDRASLVRLAELCEERGVRLFGDEVYRGLELDPARTLPQVADLSPTALSLNVTSKAYGLPGLRVGWLACRDRALLERLEQRKHYTSICNAGPSEFLATIALEASDAILTRNRAIIAENVPLFDAFFSAWPEHFAWEPPQGGCVAYPQLLGDESSLDFCTRAVEDAGVLLLPADLYVSELAATPSDRFRIGVGRRNPSDGLAALHALMEQSS
jgi:aspartate/methionine/tyrosine aminotransferase